MSAFTIRLLGPFLIWRDDELIPSEAWPTQKTKSLFKILITERGHVVPKARLVEYLWPDLAPSSAANSLRVSISQLRRMLEPDLERPADSTFIRTRAHGYRFEVSPNCWIDVDAFREAVALGQHWAQRHRWGPATAAFRNAEDLYHGGYLEEDPYAEWAIRVRERLREAYLTTLGHLAECQARIGRYHQAVATCEKILARDPVRESIYRQLMVYHYQLGQRAQALRTYERCRTMLLEQFGVNPMPRTQAIHTEILRKEAPDVPIDFRRTPAPVEAGKEPGPDQLPFVGRDDEMAWLRDHLTAALSGSGRLVLISGEAGVGKSRLVEEFLAVAKAHSAQIFSGQCHELERDLPFQPVREGLRPYLLRHLGPERARRILGRWAPHVARLVPEVKELVPNLPALEPLPPERERQRLLIGLVGFCLSLASRYPLVFFLDNLHWSDPSTLQGLHLLAQRIADARVLIVGAFREGELEPDHPVTTLEQHLTMKRLSHHLTLQRLPSEAVTALVAQKADPKWDSQPFAQRLYEETEGNALFLAELLQSLLEKGLLLENEAGCWQPAPGADLTADAPGLPAPVRTVIERRYQAAGAAGRQILEAAAVIGRNFDYQLLQQVSELDIKQILNGLDDLLRRQLIRERTETDQAVYEFSHRKICDVVYAGLSQARRVHLHSQVAEALASIHAAHLEEVAGRLAYHYAQAGKPQQAAAFRLQAGNEALRLSAHQEAITHLTAGLALLKPLPDTPARAEQELKLQMALGTVLMATKGYGATDLERVHDRALAVCQQLGDSPRLVLTRARLWTYYYLRGDLQTALELAQQCWHDAETAPEGMPLPELPHLLLGCTRLYLGEVQTTRQHIRQALALYTPEQRLLSRQTIAVDSYTACLVYMGWIQWLLGYPEQAQQWFNDAKAAAQEINHPFSRCFVLGYTVPVAILSRDDQRARDDAEALVALAHEHGLTHLEMEGRLLLGVVQLQAQDQVEAQAMAQIEKCIQFEQQEMGRTVPSPLHRILPAHAYARVGQLEKGLEALSEAQMAIDTTGECMCEADLHRLRGDLLLAQSDTTAAEQSLRTALDVARRQQAKLFELRASVSLARLLRQQGRPAEARELLADIYGWFSEGFDTPDLREAQALLEALETI